MKFSKQLGLVSVIVAALGYISFTQISIRAADSPSATTAFNWQQDATQLVWRQGDKTIWRFSFDSTKGKPYFDPISVSSGPSLTNFRPQDHPWHYGLWFSWKYINHVNYWEEDQSGKAQGSTKWKPPEIQKQPDGSAKIKLELTYTNPAGQVDMTETRNLSLSAPDANGTYSIDWTAHFTAGKEKLVLDRTPIPGEPGGQVNGGYAGLGIRMAGDPLGITFITTQGPVAKFESDRARPNVPAVACNFTQGTEPAGAIAILADPTNAGADAPWYLINSTQMRFACSAILAPKPRTVEAGGQFDLKYRITLQKVGWTPQSLQAAYEQWRKDLTAN